ncbi:RIP metalloprotease RseP [Desulfovibrio ferrophilus]|uniref:Zinc metalloprotease n=1 Tax=Desulfovibrio ferrophilus TaxID=241368 RepID=A0A2Z6AZL3_9BACT|nr:RIP metalloprotease RseP [Desulfovibrio ferrophilus]BBD08633.1 membrane-associated zinc metalloprotease [Desulfovibrio ferrophilus]
MQGTIAVILVLGALIFFHELGHFIVARLLGVGVKAFSLGFGPKLVGFRRGQTDYKLSLIPLGGYVSLLGEGGDEEDLPEGFTREESFALRPPLHRMMVVAAGPIFNFVLAWFILWGLFFVEGKMDLKPVVGTVQESSAAQIAGLQPGDFITAIDGEPVIFWKEMTTLIQESEGRTLLFTVDRDSQQIDIQITPRLAENTNLFGETITTPMVGIGSRGDVVTQPMSFGEAMTEGGMQTLNYIKVTLQALIKIVERAIPLDTVGGPIMIAQLVSDGAEQGLTSVLFLTAIISVNLGLINLFPIPVLDGGHILFCGLEMIFRRPVSEKWQIITTRLGIMFLVMLMGLAIFNDLYRLFS